MGSDPVAPKSYLIGQIREILAQDQRVNDLNVTVSISGNKVFLSGTVASEERRDAISEVMAESFPDLDCANETKVGQYPETAEAELLN